MISQHPVLLQKDISVVPGLTIERNEMFDLAFSFVTETSENIFLTGKAGTGKTTFLRYLREHCAKNIVVAAPTGVAAINAGGVTLHSLFQLPFTPFIPTRENKQELTGKLKFNKQRQDLLRKMELLVIDEISMVRADVMDAIDCILRSVRRNHGSPFGGVQLLCIGDLYQLPPVAQRQEWQLLQEFYPSPFFFDSLVIREQMPVLIELDTIFRQKQDSFVRLLNKIRNNEMEPDDFEDLHTRYSPGFRPGPEEKFITLTSHNTQADGINNRELDKLFSREFKYKAEISDDFPPHMFPAEENLILKEGAQVMFLKNDNVFKKYFNGKIGTIKYLEENNVVVEADGFEINVPKETWENTRYSLNRSDGKLEQELLGTFSQFPLRLAWAITIHKSQGLTFEKTMIDAGSAFSSGQVYVALSRCTSLEGIVLLSKITTSAIYSNDHVIKGQQALTHRGSLAERFEGARQVFTLQLLEEIFLFQDISAALGRLLYQVKHHSQYLNKTAVDWIIELDSGFRADAAVGLKFISHVSSFMKDEPVIEKNQYLQKRVSDAAVHFESRFSAFLAEIKNHPLVTENRETSVHVNEALQETALAAYTATYKLEYCKQSFEISGFLKHKLSFVLPRYNISCYASGKKQDVSGIPNPTLFETLKRWRDMACEESGQPIYMVANLNSLKDLCTYLPLEKKDLLQISGFGKAKVEKYGTEILDAIQDYCSAENLTSQMDSLSKNEKKLAKSSTAPTTKVNTKLVSFELFKSGKSMQEIAQERSYTLGTIVGHLAHYVESGEILVNALVDDETVGVVTAVLRDNKEASLVALKELLPPRVDYETIRLVLAAEKFRDKSNKPSG